MSATYNTYQTYHTVQIVRDANIELNSNLIFTSYGCSLSLKLDMARVEICIVKDRPFCEVDELSFSHPKYGMEDSTVI